MHRITFQKYEPKEHYTSLQKWLSNEEIMHLWGMNVMDKKQIDMWLSDETRLIIILKNEEKEIIGMINIYKWNKLEHSGYIGIAIDPKFQDRGYGTLALNKCDKYFSENYGLKKIRSYVEKYNERSKHITEKSGYKLTYFDNEKQRYYFEKDI